MSVYYPEAPRGRLGWPLVPSQTFPGERCLACPNCGSRNVTLTAVPPVIGTGPGGTPRMGDPGWREANRCEDCKHRVVESDENPCKPADPT